jgi:hypothetical protein
MAGVTTPNPIVDALSDEHAPRQLPAGEVLIAEVSEETTELLCESVAELREQRRDVHACLIGLPHDMDAVDEVAERFDKTVLVDESNRDSIPELLPFLPALFHKSAGELTGIGSARLSTVNIRGDPPASGSLLTDIRARRGRPLHEHVDQPDVFTFAAPPAYHDVVYRALSGSAPIVNQQEIDETAHWIKVVGFGFE